MRLFLLACASFSLLAAADGGERQAVRLLAIGNSFSNNVLNQLPALAKAGGRTLEYAHCMFGGASLQQHWARVEIADKDPADLKGHYTRGSEDLGSLRTTLARKPWDVVTIQQYSWISHDPVTYRPFADKLVALIRAQAPQAGILMHQTWAYRNDDPRFAGGQAKERESADNQAEVARAHATAPGKMRTSVDMHQQVAAAYRGVAQELGLGLIPVGDAFALVEADALWGFTRDPAWDAKTAMAPALPDQSRSLHVGWTWKRKKDGEALALSYDGHHANAAGEYLGACVWYETLFHASPVGNPYRPASMPEAQARFLQEIAHQVAAGTPALR